MPCFPVFEENDDVRQCASNLSSLSGSLQVIQHLDSSHLQRFQQTEVRVSRKVRGLFVVASKCRQITGIF